MMIYDEIWCSNMFFDILMMIYDVLWCSTMFSDVLWCSMIFHVVLCLKGILGFLLSERTSGVSPVIFDLVQSHQLKRLGPFKTGDSQKCQLFYQTKKIIKVLDGLNTLGRFCLWQCFNYYFPCPSKTFFYKAIYERKISFDQLEHWTGDIRVTLSGVCKWWWHLPLNAKVSN